MVSSYPLRKTVQVIPAHTQAISGHGNTILPGLFDAHVHAGPDPEDLKQPLRFGVTTVLDMHNEPKAVAELTIAAQSSHLLTDFKSACHAATVEGGWPAPVYQMSSPDVRHGIFLICSIDPEKRRTFDLTGTYICNSIATHHLPGHT
jgi:hypothetical protein